ncbi:MAG: DUF4349 domain-containing protein [Armatimonadetes bacterium]|nr:DUF4349 domain-containing protein [Armatimonadota bacterium]
MTKKIKLSPILWLLPLMLIGCGGSDKGPSVQGIVASGEAKAAKVMRRPSMKEDVGGYKSDTTVDEAMAPQAEDGAVTASAPTPAVPEKSMNAMPRKIIYTGSVALKTDDLDAAAQKLELLIARSNAYLGSAKREGAKGGKRTGIWTIRIPSGGYQEFVKEASKIGELQSANQTADDVSEEYYDAVARLKNKRIEEQRLIDLLQRASGKLGEILTVEREISRVRGEVEEIEGRLRFLSNQATFSTVTVTIEEVKDFQPVGPPGFGTEIGRSFTGSAMGLLDNGKNLVILLASLLPYFAIFVGMLSLARKPIMRWLMAVKKLLTPVAKPPVLQQE